MKRIVVEVEDDLHQRLKIYCAKKAESIKDEIIALVCGVLDSEEVPKKDQTTEREDQNKQTQPPFIIDLETGKLERERTS